MDDNNRHKVMILPQMILWVMWSCQLKILLVSYHCFFLLLYFIKYNNHNFNTVVADIYVESTSLLLPDECRTESHRIKCNGQKVTTDTFRQIGQKVTICNLKKKIVLIRVKFQLYWTKSHILKYLSFVLVYKEDKKFKFIES